LTEQEAVDAFHTCWYNNWNRTWEQVHWLGAKALKCPLDLWIYQELLYRIHPDVVIECGTAFGGGAAFLASIMDLLDHGRVVTVDLLGTEEFPQRPAHPRITYLKGSSTDLATLDRVKEHIGTDAVVLVILDSDHREAHVTAELELYAPLVSSGSYLIVEDTNVNGHPVVPEHGPGPMEALNAFLPTHPEFEVDEGCEKFFMTFNPNGYLRRR
jgi:cephalosporin hydroxylase